MSSSCKHNIVHVCIYKHGTAEGSDLAACLFFRSTKYQTLATPWFMRAVLKFVRVAFEIQTSD